MRILRVLRLNGSLARLALPLRRKLSVAVLLFYPGSFTIEFSENKGDLQNFESRG
jgi:hypothetical protein